MKHYIYFPHKKGFLVKFVSGRVWKTTPNVEDAWWFPDSYEARFQLLRIFIPVEIRTQPQVVDEAEAYVIQVMNS